MDDLMSKLDLSRLQRQGDVTLVPVVGDLKLTGERRRPVGDRLILVSGEATGHHHSLVADRAEIVEDEAARRVFVRIMETTTLEHQTHAPITLEPGLYVFLPDLDYVPGELPRQVLD